MKNFVVLAYLLCVTTTMLLMNQNALVDAKPFLLPPRNFFVLTTRAPCTSERTTNCNSNPSASSSSSSGSGGGVQTYNLLAPKLRFLQTLLQSFTRAGNSGGASGGFGFTFNKFGGLRPGASATTTTTSSPDEFTEPDAVFTPDDSSESSAATTTTKTTTGTTTKTTTAGPGTSTDDTKPGYSYENDKNDKNSGVSGSISVSTNTPSGGLSTNVVISNRLSEDNAGNEKDAKTSSFSTTNGQGYKYEESKGEATTKKATTGYQYNNDNDNNGKSTSENTNGYKYEQTSSPSTQSSSGYQYVKPAENEVSR